MKDLPLVKEDFKRRRCCIRGPAPTATVKETGNCGIVLRSLTIV